MLNPVVIPLPMALAVVLALILLAQTLHPLDTVPRAASAAHGRHRADLPTANSYRPRGWTPSYRLNVPPTRIGLTVESARIGLAGFGQQTRWDHDATRELAAVR